MEQQLVIQWQTLPETQQNKVIETEDLKDVCFSSDLIVVTLENKK